MVDLALVSPHFVENDFWIFEVLGSRKVCVNNIKPMLELVLSYLVW